MNLTFQSLRSCLLAAILGLSFSACNKQEVSPAETAQLPVEESCTAHFPDYRRHVSLGYVPKLQPVSSGTARYGTATDCDYFIGFPANNYLYIVSADLNDVEVAAQIRRLITDARTTFGGGFSNRLDIATRAGDSNQYVIIGEFRANNYLSTMARERNTTVRALLAKHLRMGNWNNL